MDPELPDHHELQERLNLAIDLLLDAVHIMQNGDIDWPRDVELCSRFSGAERDAMLRRVLGHG